MKEKTYCNPLPLPQIPRGKDDWYPYEEKMFSHENKPKAVTGEEYRSVSDPTVMYHNGSWYLYPSYGMAWVSRDFVHWEHKRVTPFCPKYSPAVTPYKNGFLLTSWCCPLYYSQSPLGPFEELGAFITPDLKQFVPYDPALFTDDDGRIYLLAFASDGAYATPSYSTKIVGYELDRENPRQVLGEAKELITMNPTRNEWERQGYFHQNTGFGWVEGPHLIKHKGRYYLIYAAPDTRDPSYCMAVYYSDTSPLGPYVCQKRNPLTQSLSGIVAGAGHGCVVEGPEQSLWAFYTVACPKKHMYERRIGMDRVEVDENGELYCPNGVTQMPQYAPGEVKQGSCGYYNLTAYMRPEVSSQSPGCYGYFATDLSPLSSWVPDKEDLSPTVTVIFDDDFLCGAVRVFWAEPNYNPPAGILPGAVKFILQGYCNGEWFTLLDASENETDYNIDYRTFEEKICRRVHLKITGKPENMEIGITDFAVFGKNAHGF